MQRRKYEDILALYEKYSKRLKTLQVQQERLFGKLEQLQEGLKSFGFDDVEQAREWIDSSTEELEELRQDISEKLSKIRALLEDADVVD